ncbi:glycosyltransferase family 2 protein [Saprospiraceae bacterium]|nr:glycosyltransferase family 2 protein [Saprospiraceae bacterium]
MSYDLSIIIVNYNVRHFLQQTLESVTRANKNLSTEVWVVDNNSIDDSVEMVHREFPSVKVIANKDNPGFSKANNQAIRKSDAKYILLLNPDTVLQEDTLDKCFSFMEAHPEAGAVGAKMLDGSGQFLPESKRGFPSPWVSFCKATGLSTVFKKSKTFNRYHLGYLDENETHEIDVLCGAFMFMRSSTLDKVGLLDETFFMYGEDIDLSYRIVEGGYKVYYLPETQLIHFKGESTKKASLNYVKVFYQAMIIFAKKHFAGKGAGFLVALLNVAIIGRAAVSLIKRFTQALLPQIIDAVLIFGGLVLLKEAWEAYYFNNPDYFNSSIIYNLGVYALVYTISLWSHGVYRPYYKVGQIIRSIGVAVLILLALYGLLNTGQRFSRAILLISSFVALFVSLAIRLVSQFLKKGNFKIGKESVKRIFIVGGKDEAENVLKLLDKSMSEHKVIGVIAPDDQFDPSFHVSKWSKIKQLAELEKVNELIFCIKDLEWNQVINLMNAMGPDKEYKMVGDDKMSVLGSKSKNTSGELYTVQFQFSISRWQEKWKKRFLDIVMSIFLLLFSFITIWTQAKKGQYFGRIISVLIGKKTFVSYRKPDTRSEELPKIKEGLIDPVKVSISDAEIVHRANLLYAKNYSVWKDLEIIFRKITRLGGYDR